MKKIKFRAYNKDDNSLIYDAQDAYDYGAYGCHLPVLYFGELIEDKRFVLMQSTGLKDKNGKEIYEGDIVELWDGIRDKTKETVEWDDYHLGFHPWTGQFVGRDDIYIYDYEIEEVEVVGNIYENPELLNQ